MSRGLFYAMSARTRRSLTLLWTALFMCSLVLQYASFASPAPTLAADLDDYFQLDGNPQGSPDWQDPAGAFADIFLTDPIGLGDDIFTGGNSKDIADVSAWEWVQSDSTSVQDKNDIENAFAAGYTAPDGDLLVYFGLDRYSQNGDAQVGFWFLKDDVSKVAGGSFGASHSEGDVLVQIDFENGGTDPVARVYEWTSGALSLKATGTTCTSGGADECAISNTSTIASVWAFDAKQPADDDEYLPGHFVEGGINLTDLGLDDGCFATFFAETRSSQETTATLSDFVFGSFSLCVEPDISTQVKNDQDQGDGRITVNSGEGFYDTVVVEGDKGVAEGTVDFYVCGPTNSAQDCTSGGTLVSENVELENGEASSELFTPTAIPTENSPDYYCWRVEYEPAAGSKYLAAEHTNSTSECAKVIPADVQIVKTPNDGSASAGDPISFTLSWSNGGEGAAKGVSINDPLPAGDGLDWAISGSTGSGSVCEITGSVGGQTLVCAIGTIAGNPNYPNDPPVSGTVTVTSDTSAAECGDVDNTGYITSTNDGSDENPGAYVVLCPDVTVEKTPDGGQVNAGQNAVFTIVVTNDGPGTAYGVTLEDDLPAGYTWTLGGADAAACAIDTSATPDLLECDFGTLADGDTRTITLSAPTTGGDCAVIDNLAEVAATNEPGSATGNNSDAGDIDVLCADIDIEKVADPAGPVSAGEDIGFDIVVTNDGDGTADGVVVTDTLPTNGGLGWVLGDVTGDGDPQCAIAAGVLTCTADELAAGESFTVSISSPTTSATCGVVSNTASVDTDNDGSDEDTATVTVQCPDVTVVKLADADPINAGDPIGFGITVTNNGPGTAFDVTLTDTLPAGIDWTEDSDACSIAAGVLTCSWDELADDQSVVVNVDGVTDAADCGTVTNTATVGASNEPTSAGTNNTSTDSVVVNCPDVSVVKSGNGPISAGQEATFTITLSNAGPGAAYDVTLEDQLPAGSWTLGGADAADCSIDGSNLLTCDFGTVAAGDDRVITVSKTTDAADCDAIDNDVTVGASNEAEDDLSNNTDDATIVVDCPDIQVDKSGNGPISAGEEAVFTITLTNLGPGTAFDVTLDDDLPAGVEWTLGGANAGDCTIDTSVDPDALHCDFGTLAPDASRTITLTGETTAADCGEIPNLAVGAASNEHDDDLDNNEDDATIVVNCPAIVITKTADAAVVNAGDEIGFTIEVTNTGAGSAFGVTVTDALPAGFTWSEDPDAAGWSIVGGNLTFGPATLASGQSTSVHIVAMSDAEDCGVVPNTAFLTYTGGSDDDDAEVTIDCPDLTVIKSGNGPIVNGQTATFTITTTNQGPGTAYDVTLEDQLPAGDWTLGGADAADCAIDGSNELTCDFGDLADDESRTITVSKTATTDDCGTIPNEVTVGAGNEAEADTDNNSDDAAIDVRCPEVDLEKEADDDLVEPNQTVTYTIDVSVVNGPVTNAVVTDELPDGQTFVVGSAAPIQPVVSNGGKTLTWTFASLETGDPSVTITYDVTIDADATGDPQENTAEVCVAEETPCASDVEIVTPQFPEIQIIKTVGDAADGGVFATEPGPVTYTYEVTNTGPLTLLDVTVTDDAGTPADTSDDFQADCPATTLDPAESMTCTFTIDVLVDTTNIAVARGVTAEGNPAEDDDPAEVRVLEHGLVIDKTNDAPLETLELPDGSTADLPTADEGDTVTYTLDYTFAGDPVTNGVITDVLPLGVTYVVGSATNDAQFTFQGYDEATRTLTWTAPTVSANGSVEYQATVDVGASELAQPLVNVAVIESDQTPPDDDDSPVFVPTVPAGATATPQITLPPTDGTLGQQTPSNPGFTLMLILLALAAVVLVVGFITPVPASVRARERR